jgi:hypothetical protein
MEEHPELQPDPAPDAAGVWKRVLGAGTPREVLARLVDGDPLRIGPRCQERLASQRLLMDLRRLHLRAVAHVARNARSYRGAPVLDVWLAEQVRRSVKELLDEDRQRLREDPPETGPGDPWLQGVGRILGVDPALVARGCAMFNLAPYPIRSAFFGIVLAGEEIGEWARSNGMEESTAQAAVRRALWILGLKDEADLDGFLEEGDDGP